MKSKEDSTIKEKRKCESTNKKDLVKTLKNSTIREKERERIQEVKPMQYILNNSLDFAVNKEERARHRGDNYPTLYKIISNSKKYRLFQHKTKN